MKILRCITRPLRFLISLGIPRPIVLCSSFLFIWLLGAVGFLFSQEATAGSVDDILSALYHSLQMFGLNFDLPENKSVHWCLQIARFLAPLFVSFSVIWAVSQPLRHGINILLQAVEPKQRIVVIGYGAVGQAIARRHMGNTARTSRKLVTAVERDPDQTRLTQARTDKVLLIGGDGSDQKTLGKIALHYASRVYIFLSDDMATLDAANAVRLFLAQRPGNDETPPPGVVALLRDADIDHRLVDATASGSALRKWISSYSLPQMAAEELCRQARFDRTALEAGQKRAHLAIFGCGQQGDAIAVEALLTLWRNDLAPPMLTVLDKDSAPIAARWRQTAPALFLEPGREEGALPAGSKPDIRFRDFELGAGTPWPDLSDAAPVTAYILATGDDTVNLKAALSLETAMMRRQIDAAPIYMRLWNGHRGDTAEPGFGPLSLIRPFGSLENIVATGEAFEDDPDRMAKVMHDSYHQVDLLTNTEKKNSNKEQKTQSPVQKWEDLAETLRIANRRLNKHWMQKLEDLGFQWNATIKTMPRISASWADRFNKVVAVLQKDKERNAGNHENRNQYLPSPREFSDFAPLADLIRRSAITEHDRWMADRVLDGWQAARQRDDTRRHHDCITKWMSLDPEKQSWDTVFLRALVNSAATFEDAGGTRAHGKATVCISLAPCDDGTVGKTYGFMNDSPEGGDLPATELVVTIPTITCLDDLRVIHNCESPNSSPSDGDANASLTLAKTAFATLLAAMDRSGSMCRVRFVFYAPPPVQTLEVAQALADAAAEKNLEVSTTWSWKAAG